MPATKIRLSGLSKFDRRDLGEGPGIEYQENQLEGGQHGEVITFVALFAMSAVPTLAAYLLRKHSGQTFEEDVEIVHPDGRIERRRVRWRANSAEAPEASIIKQIQSSLPGTS
jgi:hypothetical protein